MLRYVIHIGPAKTGSKYLQSSLAGLRHALQEDGIYYPDDWWTPRQHISHAPLMEILQAGPDERTEQVFRQLQQSRYHTVVLSCEGFNVLPVEKLRYWRSLLGASPVEIVFYCRRWSERIPSSWQQTLKEGHFETLPESCVRAFRNPAANHGINYALTWQKFASVFGRDSLRLVSYSNLRDAKIDIVRHFLTEVVHWDKEYELSRQDLLENVSPDPVQTEILRALNYLHFLKTEKRDFRVRVKFFKLRDPSLTEPLATAMESEKAALRIDDTASVFDRSFGAISEYKDRLVSPERGTDIFRRRANDFTFIRSDYAFKDGAREALHNLYDGLWLRDHGLRTDEAARFH